MQTQATSGPLLASSVRFRLCTWTALFCSLGLCAAVSCLYWAQKKTTRRLEQTIKRLHTSRLDLAKDLLYAMSSGNRGSGFRTKEARSLLNQAVSTLELSKIWNLAAESGSRNDAVSRVEFERQVGAFDQKLNAWTGARGKARVELGASVRNAFAQLQRQASLLDWRGHQELRVLSKSSDRRLALALAIALLFQCGICTGACVTGRKKSSAEGALRKSREQLRLVVDNLPDTYVFRYVREPDGTSRFTSVSAGIERVHGLKAADILRDTGALRSLVPAEDLSNLEATIADSAEHMTDFEVELRVKQIDGDFRLLLLRSRPHRDGAGRILWDGMATDITERRRAEDALRRNEGWLREMSATAHVGGWEFDPATGEGNWTDEVACIHDMPPDSRTNRDIGLSVYHGRYREQIEAALKAAVEEGRPYDLELEMVTPKGNHKWVRTQGVPILRDSRVERVRGTLQDISDRKRPELALREREQQLRLFVEHSPAAIAIVDHQMRYLIASHRWLTDYRLEDRDVVGRSHYEVFPEIPERWKTIHRRCLEGAIEKCDADPFRRADGSTDWVRWEVHPWRNAHGKIGGLILFSEVITERKRLADEREITLRLLALLNAPSSTKELIQQVTRQFRDWFDCQAVGIRLREGDDFPYFETSGFPAAFVEKERFLCQRNVTGQLVCDAVGNPVLECMCGNVLCRRFNPEKPFFTARGNFFSNNTSSLLAGTTEADRQGRTRNCCSGEGYESVAVVALRSGKTTYGLIQLNDKRRDRFSPERVALLERLADSLAIGIAHRQDQAQLQESEKRYRRLFESANDAIFVNRMAPDGGSLQFVEVNQVACDWLGFSRKELLQKAPSDIRLPYAEGVYPAIQKHFIENKPAVFQAIFVAKDRRRLLGEVSAHTFQIGKEKYILAIARDLTERKRAEEALRLQSAALEAAANAILIVNRAGEVEWSNPAFTALTGYTAAEARGQNLRFLKSDCHDASFYRTLWNTILDGEVWRGEITNRRKDGQLYTEHMTITPLRDSEDKIAHFIAIKQDITKEKQLEAQLRQAQKMKAVGQLAGGVAHDFNNILGAIIMQSDLTAMTEGLPEAVREGLQQIRASADRAASLTRRLLLFSRKQVMQTRDLDLNEVVTSLTKMLQRIIGEDVRLQLHLHPAPLILHADAGMLEQILMNLAVNARDAMPKGGRLLIETAEKNLDGATVSLPPEAQPGRHAWLSVSDTGCGIPRDVLPHLFEPFFTTKEPGKGTGLGLATVFGIVKQHRGWIRVYSEPGNGANFQIFLPACNASPVADGPVGRRTKLRGGTETILLAEDDSPLRGMTRTLLERHGYKILMAVNAAEALKIWRQNQTEVALLLTDLVMPDGISGQQLARKLQADKPDLKVIFTSGYSAEIAGREIRLRDGENFVQKPFPPDQLLQTIRSCLDG